MSKVQIQPSEDNPTPTGKWHVRVRDIDNCWFYDGTDGHETAEAARASVESLLPEIFVPLTAYIVNIDEGRETATFQYVIKDRSSERINIDPVRWGTPWKGATLGRQLFGFMWVMVAVSAIFVAIGLISSFIK